LAAGFLVARDRDFFGATALMYFEAGRKSSFVFCRASLTATASAHHNLFTRDHAIGGASGFGWGNDFPSPGQGETDLGNPI
jgi:hypothetical protein